MLTQVVIRSQPLDVRIRNRLEASISKSSLVGGKTLKLTNEVLFIPPLSNSPQPWPYQNISLSHPVMVPLFC